MGVFTVLISTAFLFSVFDNAESNGGGILFPQESETREKISLDGLWNFIQSNSSRPLSGYMEHWYEKRFIDLNITYQVMPVPASYNDISTDWKLRDHVGIVWYERFFRVPNAWDRGKVWLRFGSVSYAAQVWINGIECVTHQIGHLPFQTEITDLIYFGKENRITVACDNSLFDYTIPQGKIETLINGRLDQTYTFDFFNYAGIDRSVVIYSTPKTYVDDITVLTENLEPNEATLTYDVKYINNTTNNVTCSVELFDKMGNSVSSGSCNEGNGVLKIVSPILWWPYLMNENPGYLHSFEVKLFDENRESIIDIYRLPIGIRKLTWDENSFFINGEKLYLHGFGRHEDSDIRGKGLDLPLIIRDYNLIKWIGANAYRTSHYPYAEEIMDLADSMGIMIIDECPAVDLEGFGEELLENHKGSLSELIRRDKNRPSVIMWSLANEPRTQQSAAASYFEDVAEHVKELDTSRPTTIVENRDCTETSASFFVDIVSFNRYNGWYHNEGHLDGIASAVVEETINWHERFRKPVIMQEYGADTLEGLHFQPDYIWSEEYQVDLMSEHFRAFDKLREGGFFLGEFIWNFADFKTAQTYKRVGGNKKGIFTRNRQPKASAHHLRKRYWKVANDLYNATLPGDLGPYYWSSTKKEEQRDEL